MSIVPLNATLCTPDCPGRACPKCHGQRWYVTDDAKAHAKMAKNAERYHAALQEIVDYYLNHAGWEYASWEAERAMEALHPDA